MFNWVKVLENYTEFIESRFHQVKVLKSRVFRKSNVQFKQGIRKLINVNWIKVSWNSRFSHYLTESFYFIQMFSSEPTKGPGQGMVEPLLDETLIQFTIFRSPTRFNIHTVKLFIYFYYLCLMTYPIRNFFLNFCLDEKVGNLTNHKFTDCFTKIDSDKTSHSKISENQKMTC